MFVDNARRMTVSARRACAFWVAGVGVLWLLINKSVAEGPTLLVLGAGRGVTVADLLSMAAFAVAAYLWLPRRWAR
jgi:hypothetical protein